MGPVWDRVGPEDRSKLVEAPPSEKFRQLLGEVAPCASKLYEAVARGQLSQQMEEQLGAANEALSFIVYLSCGSFLEFFFQMFFLVHDSFGLVLGSLLLVVDS